MKRKPKMSCILFDGTEDDASYIFSFVLSIVDAHLKSPYRTCAYGKLLADLLKPRISAGDSRQREGSQVLSGVIITNGFICIIIRGKYVT